MDGSSSSSSSSSSRWWKEEEKGVRRVECTKVAGGRERGITQPSMDSTSSSKAGSKRAKGARGRKGVGMHRMGVLQAGRVGGHVQLVWMA
jgi:hypothetical protein